jgi:OOP family OmpA-OmpF porin
MQKLAALLVGTMALGLAATASAQPVPYIQGNLGAVIMNNPTTSFTFPPRIIRNVTVTSLVGGPVGLDPSFKAKMDVGFGVSVSAGYQGLFIPEFRVEGEINYHSNQIDTVTSSFLPSPHSFGATGSIDSIGLMLNGYYDFLNSSAWTPYLGGGIGAAHLAVTDAGIPALSSFTASARDWQFAYQGIAGVRYSFTPSISASLDYRYFATTDPKFTLATPLGTVSAKTEYHTHNIMLGLAYHFLPAPPPPPVAAAPPPPPAPAPPAPTRQFVVYFEFDKSDLTPEGAKVVSDAAAAYKQTGSARIAVTGYTDLAGTQQYNLGLSKRRADTVRGALVRQGVPDGAIAEAWKGKQNPAVPTPDGVREPRNRRVEIML